MMFSESDLKIISSARTRIDAEYENLYDLFNFPPFGTKYEEFFGKEDYISNLIDARIKILQNETNLLMGDYDLFSDFKKMYEKSIKEAQEIWSDPIVTELSPLGVFYPAEDYHQDYFNQNQSNPYCQVVINPKLSKFKKTYQEFLKQQ